MRMDRDSCLARHMCCGCLCALFTFSCIEWAAAAERGRLRPDQNTGVNNGLDDDPPVRCAGYGELGSISLTDWEAGLGSWTVGTHDIANPNTFDTPDWSVVGSLPDGQTGMAAFVPNLDIGDCESDDESGALTLDSPSIVIPEGALVPRISVHHWVATEPGYDGGNFKISVNGGGFNLIPASAIEFNSYNSTLFPDTEKNTNPLAGEDAFTGAVNGGKTGSWGQSHITLFGIAEEEDNFQLRFDFGIDLCDGLIGWYVDEVEVYSCAAELPPSDCGNGVIDPPEQCDDGNNFIDDGCSNICRIDDGWQCTAPTPPGVVPDASFEAGTDNPFWTEASTTFENHTICSIETCGTSTGSGPAEGDFWAWLGGVEGFEEASVSQSVVFPATATELQFELEASQCDSTSDYVELLVDGNQEFFIDGSNPLCGSFGYTTQSVDISAYADGGAHNIEFHSESFGLNSDVSNFFIDVVSIPGNASLCTRIPPSLTLIKEVINDNGGATEGGATSFQSPAPPGAAAA